MAARARVYLREDTLAQIEAAGIELAEGVPLTLSDYDADDDGTPLWLVADGVLGYDHGGGRWYMDYEDVSWEPRDAGS
jgi:hypothetical protein